MSACVKLNQQHDRLPGMEAILAGSFYRTADPV